MGMKTGKPSKPLARKHYSYVRDRFSGFWSLITKTSIVALFVVALAAPALAHHGGMARTAVDEARGINFAASKTLLAAFPFYAFALVLGSRVERERSLSRWDLNDVAASLRGDEAPRLAVRPKSAAWILFKTGKKIFALTMVAATLMLYVTSKLSQVSASGAVTGSSGTATGPSLMSMVFVPFLLGILSLTLIHAIMSRPTLVATDQRIFFKGGVLFRSAETAPIGGIRDVEVKRGTLDRLLKTATLHIRTENRLVREDGGKSGFYINLTGLPMEQAEAMREAIT